MKQDQLIESTIKPSTRKLRHIAKFATHNNPPEVTSFLANKKGKNSYMRAFGILQKRFKKAIYYFWIFTEE
jgi:hypothetical protein